MSRYYNEIIDFISRHKVINTHCHHLPDESLKSLKLKNILSMSYISWISSGYEDNEKGRRSFLELMGSNTYFTWLARSLGELYGDGKPLCIENWDLIDMNLCNAYYDEENHLKVLTDKCKYEAIILDKYNLTGSDNGHRNLNRPAFRCDMFLHAYDIAGCDQNGNNPFTSIGTRPDSLEDYIINVEHLIHDKKKAGCVALKVAIAYERGLDFTMCTYEKAKKAYLNPQASQTEKKVLQDYIMFKLCELSEKFDMPIQIHTGLGRLQKSNAMHLREIIECNPRTKFVLFHCSYPWFDDVLALTHNYKNVYPDLCWVPIISTSACERFLNEALEVGDAGRFCWGCDTWTSEESYGALLAVRHVLARTLSQKIEDGMIDKEYALVLAKRILFENAKSLYKLDD